MKVGDLVQVVKPTLCCGNDTAVGWMFVVAEISEALGWCSYCDYADNRTVAHGHPKSAFTPERLKVIPPAEELGVINEKEEIPA